MNTVMTVIQILLLLVGGMPLFDSICTAFGTAGTGGFGIKICCCISGCCDNGTNLESCLLKSFGCTSENMVNIAGDDKNCNTDDSEIIPHFFHFKSLSKFFCDNEKVSIKVNAK